MYLKQVLSFTERNYLVVDSLEMICVEIKKPYKKPFSSMCMHGIDHQIRIPICLMILKFFFTNVILQIKS